MKAVARLKHFGVPPLKVRRYARTIKGKDAMRAVSILDLQPSPICQTLSKLLKSAIANAQNNLELAPDSLEVSNVLVDQGPTMKRIRPRARGRAYRVLKRSCHVTIELDLKKSLRERQAKPEAGESGAAEPKRKPAARKPAAKKAAGKKPADKKAATKKKTESAPAKTAKKPAASKAKSGGKSEVPKDPPAKDKPAKGKTQPEPKTKGKGQSEQKQRGKGVVSGPEDTP
ncbi:MAG TPA: 50S ribosomal protein L22 [Firmicutes bacterium]|nr:50S ribosomal protein L22 [Bacillota bacterium]